jgi:hypothetical protein
LGNQAGAICCLSKRHYQGQGCEIGDAEEAFRPLRLALTVRQGSRLAT